MEFKELKLDEKNFKELKLVEKIMSIPKEKRTKKQKEFLDKMKEYFVEVAQSLIHSYEIANELELTKF